MIKNKCSVVGRGYAGKMLNSLIENHPFLALEFEPQKNENIENWPLETFDTIFLATPSDVSLGIVDKIKSLGWDGLIIDLSDAFRSREDIFYGLSPWNKALPDTKIVANPGCYATAIQMALLPILSSGIMPDSSIVIDAKSGITGAGKKLSEEYLFNEIYGTILPYNIGEHRHLKEILWNCKKTTGKDIDILLSTHLLPLKNGISAAIYFTVKNTDGLNKKVEKALLDAYKNYPLVKVQNITQVIGKNYTKEKQMLSLYEIAGKPFTWVSYKVLGDKVFIFSIIDNLIKGAAGQAIENFNVINGYPVETGLLITK